MQFAKYIVNYHCKRFSNVTALFKNTIDLLARVTLKTVLPKNTILHARIHFVSNTFIKALTPKY